MRGFYRFERRSAFIVFAVFLASAGHLLSHGGEVRMIAVAGEGAKFWPRCRGPSGQGLVVAGKYANTWSPGSNVKWRVAVPGAGNSSPIVWGDRIYLTTPHDYGRKLSMLA